MGSASRETVIGSSYEDFTMRHTCSNDPLVVTVLPLGDRMAHWASEGPAHRSCYPVPFGLTRTPVPQVQAIALGRARYDPVRQITMMPEGTPFIDEPSMKSTLYTTIKTTEDMQSWPDSVADGTD
jgi:putative ATP-grasp target RiPP